MDATVDAPLQWVESITMLCLPEQADRRKKSLFAFSLLNSGFSEGES